MAIYTDIFGGSPIQPSLSSFNIFELDSDIVLQWPTSFQDTDNVVSGIMDVNPTADGFTIRLPDATLVSPGNAFFFINISPNPLIGFNVHASNGDPIINNITNVEGYFLYLRDNTTPHGGWGILPFKGADAVTYVGATSLTPGFNIAGSPIEGAGTFEFTLDLPTVWNNVANDTLTGTKLLLNSMPSGVLVDGSLSNLQFSPNSISGNNISNSSLPALKLVNGSLTNAQFTPNTISGNIIEDGSIPPEKIIAGPFDLTALWNAQADDTLTGSKISDDSLNGSKITDASVTTGKLAANTLLDLWDAQGAGTLTGAKIGTAGSMSGTVISNNSLDGSKITDASVATSKLAAGTLQTLWNAQGAGTLTGAKISAGTVPGTLFAAALINNGNISTAPSIVYSFNVSSVEFVATGICRFTLATTSPGSQYIISCTAVSSGQAIVCSVFPYSSSQINVATYVGGTVLTPNIQFYVAVFVV